MSNQIVITLIQKNLKKYLPLFKLIISTNKYFDINSFNYIAVVNNGNIDVGVIGIKLNGDVAELQLFQAPRVCRLSIISIIEASIPLIQILSLTVKNVTYVDMPASYSFKLTSMFKSVAVVLDEKVTIPLSSITNFNILSVTSKNIIINSE